jgi:hypothetical protein
VKHLPISTPFIRFRKYAIKARKMIFKLRDDPLQHVLNDIVGCFPEYGVELTVDPYRQRRGDSTPSITRDILVKESADTLGSGARTIDAGGLHLTPEALNDISWVSGSMYGGMFLLSSLYSLRSHLFITFL